MAGAPAARTTPSSSAGSIVPVDVGVPVPARTELVPRVVAVHQVDPAGDRLDLVRRVGQVDAGRVGVAGIQAETQVRVVTGRVADRVPERPIASSDLAMAPSPAGVFSISIGSGRSIRSTAFASSPGPFPGRCRR